MPRTLSRFLATAALATLCLAQVSSELITPDIRRVGSRLACLCGSCKNSVGDCAMLGCHYSKPAREKIRDMQAKGMSDDAIIAEFVKTEGKRALAVPPSEGFFNLAWWMPPFFVGLGLVAIYFWMRKMKPPLVAADTPIDSRDLDRFRETIEKETANLE
ncbi:MAG: cytochrome c-type biogenesis protein CcmH [Bryobacteraceae bacterium]